MKRYLFSFAVIILFYSILLYSVGLNRYKGQIIYKLEKDGFQVFKGIFSDEEILRIRNRTEKLFLRQSELGLVQHHKSRHVDFQNFRADVIQKEFEEFDYIIFDSRILECVQSLIGPDFCYFPDSDIQVGTGYSGYHKDNVSRDNPEHSDWFSDYDVIRMGLYMQDTKNFSGGISIKRGSHKHVNLSSGKGVIVPLEMGDVVFWKLTATHSGNAKRLKIFSKIALYGRAQRSLPDWVFKPEQFKRIALFASYGKPGIHLDSYVNYLKNDANSCVGDDNIYSKSARSLAKLGNFSLI